MYLFHCEFAIDNSFRRFHSPDDRILQEKTKTKKTIAWMWYECVCVSMSIEFHLKFNISHHKLNVWLAFVFVFCFRCQLSDSHNVSGMNMYYIILAITQQKNNSNKEKH